MKPLELSSLASHVVIRKHARAPAGHVGRAYNNGHVQDILCMSHDMVRLWLSPNTGWGLPPPPPRQPDIIGSGHLI